MNPVRRSRCLRAWLPLLLPAFLSLSCGIGGSDYAGGGTGGTGISTGAVSSLGSVEVNGVHYNTNAKTKKISNGEDNSGRMDNVVFAVGMIVTVQHGTADNDARVIEYRDNLSGPIAEKASGVDNVIIILGHTIVLENAALFDSLKVNDVVEVSGFVDNAGRIRADFVSLASRPANGFEAKGYVSGLSVSGNSFRLGPLPGGSGATIGVSYDPAAISGLPTGLDNGLYVQVFTSDREAIGGVIIATGIVEIAARTEFPDRAAVDLAGLVTTPWAGSESDLSFTVEGKRVQWNHTTEFEGGGGTQEDTRQANRRVQVQGIENGGVLFATRIVFL